MSLFTEWKGRIGEILNVKSYHNDNIISSLSKLTGSLRLN